MNYPKPDSLLQQLAREGPAYVSVPEYKRRYKVVPTGPDSLFSPDEIKAALAVGGIGVIAIAAYFFYKKHITKR